MTKERTFCQQGTISNAIQVFKAEQSTDKLDKLAYGLMCLNLD